MAAVGYEDALARYRLVVSNFPGVEVKGKANPYTSLNGNMFSFLDKSGSLCLRYPKADRVAFLEEHKLPPVTQYGAIMKEYVSVPAHIAADPTALNACFETCVTYAKSLPVKATKRS